MSGSSTSALVVPGAIVAAKYRLDALIGEGGMGSVWAATHLGLNRAVAIKFISREFVKSPEALRRFDAEAKAAAQIRSRHVVQVFDSGALEEGTPYIAMELLHGETLQGRLRRGAPVPLAEAIDILSQCCKALGRAHAAGIIHRDIKPDNIFLAQSNDDDSALVKVLDFGVAKMGGGANDQGSQGATRTGAVLGTPLFMSPEQARGLRSIDQRTDLYSLGLVAYTILTGNLAFTGESFGDLLLQICTAPLPSINASAPWLPPEVDAWFQKACAREPSDRFGSAQEFADALRTAAGVTLQSRQVSFAFEAVGPLPTGGRPAFASTGGSTSPGIARSGPPDDYVPPGTRKRWVGLVAGLGGVLVALGAAIGLVGVVGKGKSSSPAPASSPPPVETTRSELEAKPSASASAAALEALPSFAPPSSTSSAGQPGQPVTTHSEKTPAFAHAAPSVKPAATSPTPSPAVKPHAAAAATVDLGY
jgi:serine/threonine-protein kinase